MKHTIRKLLCLLLALTMTVGLLPVGMFASAADVVVLGAGQLLVDNDFASAANKQIVTAEVGGVTYQGEMGSNAFATIAEAMSKATGNASVYVAPGHYVETFNISQNIKLYGNGMNVNPNNADWSLNPKRSDPTKESIIEGQLNISTKALTNIVINGFSFTGMAGIKEATSGSTCKGIDICYNYFYDTIDFSSSTGVWYFTNTTVRSGRLYRNRVDTTSAAKPLTFRNGNNFSILENYVKTTASQTLWVSAEIADQNTNPGFMKMNISGNYLQGANYALQLLLASASTIDYTITNNYFKSANALQVTSNDDCTVDKEMVITGNTFDATSYDINFANTVAYNPDLISIKNNVLLLGDVRNLFESEKPMDFSYNYLGDSFSAEITPAPISYPRYTDTALTQLSGDMTLSNVQLTGVKASGDKESILGATINNDNKTVVLKDIIDSVYETIEIEATSGASDGDVKIEYFSDAGCNMPLTGGNVIDYLSQGTNLVYIKLTTSLDSYYSYKIYTLSIERSASRDAKINGVQNYPYTMSDDRIAITVPGDDINPNVQLNVSATATYAFYYDAALTNPVGGTVFNNLVAGTTTYFVKVMAEDGESYQVYTMSLTRAPSAKAEILAFNSPSFIEYDEFAEEYVATFTQGVTSADVDITVSDRATWKLFSDYACTRPVEPTDIALNTGDNYYYIQVSSEAAANVEVYTLNLRRETENASKEIFSVINSGIGITSSVKGESVSVALDASITDLALELNYAGKYWRMYASYEDGVLSDVVANNKLTGIVAGKHTYYIEVVAQDNSTRVYTLTLERAASKESKLRAIGGGQDSYVNRFYFEATTTVQNEGFFTPVFVCSEGATVEVFKSGTAVEFPINLRPGASTYTIVVTAEDGVTTTEYLWTITCVGEGIDLLTAGVVVGEIWADYPVGTPVYASINGVAYKVYIGENAFATYSAAATYATSRGGIIYVMPGTTISEDITLESTSLYGANFLQDANIGSRFEESVLTGTVTVTGNSSVNGFLFTETASINNDSTDSVYIQNNIFADGDARTTYAVAMDDENIAAGNVTIKGNLFEMNSTSAAIFFANMGGTANIAENVVYNADAGAMIAIGAMQAGSSVEFTDNSVQCPNGVAMLLDTVAARAGYINVFENEFNGVAVMNVNAEEAADTFAISFTDNVVNTSAIAVDIYAAPASFAYGFVANENSFVTLDLSFSVEYIASVQPNTLDPLDLTANYYGTATPDNDAFDSSYNYKPYYINAEKTVLSNTVNNVEIKVNDNEITDDGVNKFAVVPSSVANVVAGFYTNDVIPAGAYGSVYVDGVADSNIYSMNQKHNVTVEIFSLDETASETQIVNLYPQAANPVYNVYDVVASTIDGMNVSVVLDHGATTWKPALTILNNSPITFYKDAALKKELSTIKLTGDSTTIYGKVDGFEAVVFTIYKKLSNEKAILELKDAYTFEYTASAEATATVDDRKASADLSAIVSSGASYEVFADAACLIPADETAVTDDTTLYYLVTAADGTNKLLVVNVTFVSVVDPTLLSVTDTTTVSFVNNELVATVKSYKSDIGFIVNPVVNAGCTVKLYVDKDHTVICKNDTIFFASNYVYLYADVTSPDGVTSANYIIKLQKKASKVNFVDAIPSWAKKAVNYTKDLGIVTGVKDEDGLKLNASGATTREMMACFMVRMLGIDVTQYSYVDLSGFADVEEISSWALGSVKAAVELGIFEGSKDGDAIYLNPKNNITREQFAVVFARAIGADKENVKAYALKYNDAIAISSWARNAVKIMTKKGLMKGANNNFSPSLATTRAEIMQVIYNYMK